MTVAGHDEVRAASLGGFDELIIVRIVRNCPEAARDLDEFRYGPDDSNGLIGFCGRVPELGQKDGVKLCEDRWGKADTRMLVSRTTRI